MRKEKNEYGGETFMFSDRAFFRLPRLEESPQWWNMVCPSVVEFYGLHNKNVREEAEVDNETRATLFLDVPEYYDDSDNKYINI